MALLCSHVAGAAELLRQVPGSWYYGPETLYTVIGAGPASVLTFFPMSSAMTSSSVAKARFAWQMTQDSGDCKMRPAVRFSSDGLNWDAAKEVSAGAAYATDETVRYDPAFVDLQGLAGTTNKTYMQFGLQTLNRTGTAVAFCRGAMRVEPATNQ